MAWTLAADQPGLVVSLGVGRRGVPLSWRAADASVFQGRMQRDALAVSRRAVGRVPRAVGPRRGIGTADRGCAAGAWLPLLSQWGVPFSSRGQAGTHGSVPGQWRQLGP
jgi:hypothetical protein